MTIVMHFTLGVLLACLPAAAYLACFRVFWRRGEGWRSAAIDAALCWGVFVALCTEILSGPRLIARPALSAAWSLFAVAAFAYGQRLGARRPQRTLSSASPDGLPRIAERLEKSQWFLIFGIGLVVGLVGVTGLLSPPNTWDAMAYHMSRVALWMNNHDVNLYPAFYSAQLFLSPWAEYVILHLDVLYGGDRLANLVELASMIGSAVTVSLIAQQLGAGRRGQVLAAVACATIPEGVLEASGAMNTYVGAFWISVAVYYILRWREEQTWAICLAIGSASGLAILTKGTAYLFLPPVLLACWWLASKQGRKRLLVRVPAILLAVVVLNGPLYLRNYRLSGSPLGFSSPLGDDPQRQYSNSHISASVTLANIVKNLSLHVGTPSEAVNQRIARFIDSMFRITGINPNDTASTYRGGFHINRASSYELNAGNPLQLALIVLV
ncbi:MAG: ArnT family glycosyltransferase, partial [Blastocatellia bacterium]